MIDRRWKIRLISTIFVERRGFLRRTKNAEAGVLREDAFCAQRRYRHLVCRGGGRFDLAKGMRIQAAPRAQCSYNGLFRSGLIRCRWSGRPFQRQGGFSIRHA